MEVNDDYRQNVATTPILIEQRHIASNPNLKRKRRKELRKILR